jgi:hypothetical protein
LNAAHRLPQPLQPVPTRRPGAGGLSSTEALSAAWEETLRLLFRPFHCRRWVNLSAVCLFLGGGTATAAFQWSFSTLPVAIDSSAVLLHLRLIITQHLSLIVMVVTLSVLFVLALIYVRCVLRFILVEAIIKQEVAIGEAWRDLQPLGRTYFFWLLGVLGTVFVLATGVVIGSFPYLGSARLPGHSPRVSSLLQLTVLTAVVLAGLLVAVAITLTDDWVVPLIYAERISFPAAWRKVWRVGRRDPRTFLNYLGFRFAVSIAISLAVLVFLFPVLTGISSGALVATALVILALRLAGLAWAWNPATVLLCAVALLLFTGLLFLLLSVAGMPGQVYLQNYGVRFIASRTPSLEALCRASAASGRRG